MRFVLPDSVAMVDDGFAPTESPARPSQVILFQDAHTNASGQFNLAKALDRVVRAEGVRRVYVEGGWGDCSLGSLKRTADAHGLRAEAERSVRSGVLHGEEFLDLTTDLDLEIIGAEDESSYRRGLEAYAAAARSRDAALKYLDRMRRGLDDQEALILNPDLAEFRSAQKRYRKGNAAFAEWFGTLLGQARRTGVYLGPYSQLKVARRVSAMEGSLDPDRIRREENTVLGTLTDADRQELEAARPAARGRASAADEALVRSWYFLLEEKSGRAVRAYPALNRYLRYLREARKVSAPAVLKELEALEEEVLSRLSPSPFEKTLIRLQDSADLLEKLILLRITPDEYDRLKRLERFADADHLSGFVNARILEREAGYEGAILLKKSLARAEAAAKRFYTSARERDTLFLGTVQRHLDQGLPGPAVLITGGFHTSALKEQLRQKGISYVSILPSVSEETDTVRYERLLLGQNDLLSGERGPALVTTAAGQRTVPLALNSAELARLTAAAGPVSAPVVDAARMAQPVKRMGIRSRTLIFAALGSWALAAWSLMHAAAVEDRPEEVRTVTRLTDRAMDPSRSVFIAGDKLDPKGASRLRTALRAVTETIPDVSLTPAKDHREWVSRPGNTGLFRDLVMYLLISSLAEGYRTGSEEVVFPYNEDALLAILQNIGHPSADRWWAVLAEDVESTLGDLLDRKTLEGTAEMKRAVALADFMNAGLQPDPLDLFAAMREDRPVARMKLPDAWRSRILANQLLLAKLHLFYHFTQPFGAHALLRSDPAKASAMSGLSFLTALEIYERPVRGYWVGDLLTQPDQLSTELSYADFERFRTIAEGIWALATRSKPAALPALPAVDPAVEAVVKNAAERLRRTAVPLQQLDLAAEGYRRIRVLDASDRASLEKLTPIALNRLGTDWPELERAFEALRAVKALRAASHPLNGDAGVLDRAYEGIQTEKQRILEQLPPDVVRKSYPSGARMANGKHLQVLQSIITELHRINEMADWLPAVTVFGSARIPPHNPFYRLAYELGQEMGRLGIPGRTGAGPSIMEAVLMGLMSVAPDRPDLRQGIRILLPFEQETNPMVGKILLFDHFLTRKRALDEDVIATVALPGGIGSMDEFFEAMRRGRPLALLGESFWWPAWDAFFAAWKRAGIVEPMMDGRRSRPFITDRVSSVMDFIKNSRHVAEHHQHFVTPPERMGVLVEELESSYLQLHGWPASVTVVGHPASDSPLLIEAERLASRLWGSGVPVRIASENGLDRRLWERAQADGMEDLFQSVIFKSDRTGPVRLRPTPQIPAARRILIRDESLHQFLTAAHSSAFVFLPGGFGTMNRLFDIVQLMQVKKVERQPIVLLGRDYWQPILDTLRKIWLESDNIPNMVNPEDMDIFRVADTAEEAEEALRRPISAARMAAQSGVPDSPEDLIHGVAAPDPGDVDYWKKSPYDRTRAVNGAAKDGRRRVYLGQVTVNDDGFYQLTDPRGLGGIAERIEALFGHWNIPVTLEHHRVGHDTTPTRHFASIEYDYYVAVDPELESLVSNIVWKAVRPGDSSEESVHRAILQALDLVAIETDRSESQVQTGEVLVHLGIRRVAQDAELQLIREHLAPLGPLAKRIFLEVEGEMGGYTQEGIHWEKMVFTRRFWVPRDLEPKLRAYLAVPREARDRLAASVSGPGSPGAFVLRYLAAIRPTIDPSLFAEAYKAFSGSVGHWTGYTNTWSWMSHVRPLPGHEDALSGIDPIEIVRWIERSGPSSDPDPQDAFLALILTAATRPSSLTPELMAGIEKLIHEHFVWAVNAAGLLVQLQPDLASVSVVDRMVSVFFGLDKRHLGDIRPPMNEDQLAHARVALGRSVERFLAADPSIAGTRSVKEFALGERYHTVPGTLVYVGADESSLESAYKSIWHTGQMEELIAPLVEQGIPVTPVEVQIDPETYYHSESHYTMFRNLFFLRTEERYRDVVEAAVRKGAWAGSGTHQERVRSIGEFLSRLLRAWRAPGDLASRMRAAGITEAPDAVFAAVYREAVRVNPQVDLAALHRLYKEFWGKVHQVDADPRYSDQTAPGMSIVVIRHHEHRLDTPEDDKQWLDGRKEGTVRIETPTLDLVRGRLGMADAFATLSLSIENHDSTRHFFVGVERELVYVPEHAKELALLLVTAGEEEFLRAVFSESADLDARLRRGTRSLGAGIRTDSWGGKESGFLTLKRAGLDFPPGIVLSPELAVELAHSDGEARRTLEMLIARRLREEGIDFFVSKERVWYWSSWGRNSDLVVLRSNPKVSMPGVLTSSEATGSLQHGAKTVVDAWGLPKARAYRERMGLEHRYDQPLIIQKWVSGNSHNFHYRTRKPGDQRTLYLSGVMSTRDPDTGEKALYGRFVENMSGDELMTKGEAGESLEALRSREPWLHQQLTEAAAKLETAAGPQETEFVVEAGKLWFVQTRPIHFSPQAEASYLREQMASGAVSEARAVPRIEALQNRLGSRRIHRVSSSMAEPIARADASTAGAVEGRLAWDIEEARRMVEQGDAVVLVAAKSRREPILEAIFHFENAGLIALDYGNNSSHEAALARHAGIPSLIHLPGAELKTEAGQHHIQLAGGHTLVQGDRVVLDGDNGVLYAAGMAVVEPNGAVTDASHGVDIPAVRASFSAPYLDDEGRVRPEFTEARLLELNTAAQGQYDALKDGPDAAAAFKANLAKHFIHDLLTQRRREDAANAGARMAQLEYSDGRRTQRNAERFMMMPHDAAAISEDGTWLALAAGRELSVRVLGTARIYKAVLPAAAPVQVREIFFADGALWVRTAADERWVWKNYDSVGSPVKLRPDQEAPARPAPPVSKKIGIELIEDARAVRVTPDLKKNLSIVIRPEAAVRRAELVRSGEKVWSVWLDLENGGVQVWDVKKLEQGPSGQGTAYTETSGSGVALAKKSGMRLDLPIPPPSRTARIFLPDEAPSRVYDEELAEDVMRALLDPDIASLVTKLELGILRHYIDDPGFTESARDVLSDYLARKSGEVDLPATRLTAREHDDLLDRVQALHGASMPGWAQRIFRTSPKKHFLELKHGQHTLPAEKYPFTVTSPDLLSNLRTLVETAPAATRLAGGTSPETLRLFAERAAEATGVRPGEPVTFAVWNGTGGVEYARTVGTTGARLARPDIMRTDTVVEAAKNRSANTFDPEAAAHALQGIPDVPADFELPAWEELFPEDTRLSDDEVEAQVEFLLEQAAYFARLRPGTRFFLQENLSRLRPAVQESVRAAVRREPAVFAMGAAPREKGRLTVRMTTSYVPVSGTVNLAVEPLSRGDEMPVWTTIFSIPVLAAFAAIGSSAALEDPQAAFSAAQGFADLGPIERIARFYGPDAFAGGIAGEEFLSALQGKRPFLAHQRPAYVMVRATRLLQEIRAAIQQVRVMA